MTDPGFVVEAAPLAQPVGRHRTWLGVGLSSGRLGTSVVAGDVNGDGFPELYLGARRGWVGRNNAGLVIGIPGSSRGPSWEGARVLLGESVAQRLGAQLAVGQFGAMPAALWMTEASARRDGSARSVELFGDAPASGIVIPLDWPVPDSLCLPGDVDGDGLADLLVGASRESNRAVEAGEVRLYGGSEPGAPPRLLWSQSGVQAGERFGYFIKSLGDLDGDGCADFALGSPGYGIEGRPKAGRVVVYRGGKSGPVPHWEFVGTEAHLRVGVRFDSGDLDGDGNADLALGAPGTEGEMDGLQPTGGETKVPGRVFLFRSVGSGWAPEPDLTIPGPGGGRSFGASVAIVPNHFAEGKAALFVGAPMTTARFRNEGRMQSFPGHPKLLVAPSDREWLGNQGGTQFGTVVAAIGDVDHDGFQDVAFGSPFGYAQGRQGGRVDLWFGGSPRAHPPERLLAVNSRERAASLTPQPEEDRRLQAAQPWRLALSGCLAVVSVSALAAGIIWRLKRHHALEKRAAVHEERRRVARDLHDGLGSELVRLVALAEPVEAGDSFQDSESREMKESIAATARVAMRTVDEVVWAVKPTEDDLDSLLGFLTESATQFFSGTAIELRQDLPLEVPDLMVTSLERANVLFIVKEAFGNALKHSGADSVMFRVSFDRGLLTLIVQDDGRGFQQAPIAGSVDTHADGLPNMKARALEIGADLRIEGADAGTGTTVTLTLPLSR